MNTLYLHIGTPKTGTTYIQNFLAKNNEILKKNNYIYPDFQVRFDKIGPNRNGHFLVNLIKDENGNRLRDKEKEVEKKCFEKCCNLFQKYSNVILSDEQIWNAAELHRGKDFWPNLKQRFDSKHIELKIIVYLRRQDLFVQSLWAQKMKKKNSFFTIEEFLSSNSSPVLDYYNRLKKISSFIGKDNIIVRIYETGQFSQGIISADFLNAVGLVYNDEYEEIEQPTNISLTGIYLAVKQELNKTGVFNEQTDWLSPMIQAVMKKNQDVRSISSNEFFTYEESVNFMKKYRSSNEAVAREFLGRDDGILFFEDIAHQAKNKIQYELSDYIAVLAEIISMQNEQISALAEKHNSLTKQLNLKKQATNEQAQSMLTNNFVGKILHKLKNK